MTARSASSPGSTRVPRVGFGVSPKRTLAGLGSAGAELLPRRRVAPGKSSTLADTHPPRKSAKAGRLRQPAGRACSPEFRVRVFSPILAALVLLALTAFAHADSLRADFAPLTLRPRTNAPAIFDLTLHRAGAGLLEGALEITLKSGNEVLLRQRTQDLALPAGAQSFRIITPPLPPQNAYLGTDAHLRFVTKKDAIDLGIFPVAATSRAARNFVLADHLTVAIATAAPASLFSSSTGGGFQRRPGLA